MNETETIELVEIFQQFGIYRNSLSKEHNDFVKQQLQKNYDVVTKTYELQGKTYTGTFKEDSHRKENKDAYTREAKLATVLASMGFDVILIEEDNSKDGKKPDAIVNGIVMDFKEIEAINENMVGKHTVGNRYQDGMRKKPTAGVAIFLHNFSNQYISKHMEGKTNPSNNGLALFFHEDTGSLQLIDMKKIRTIHNEQSFKVGTPPGTSSEQHSLDGLNTSEQVASSSLQLNNISQMNEKSNKNEKQKKSTTLAEDILEAEKRKSAWRIAHGKALPTDEWTVNHNNSNDEKKLIPVHEPTTVTVPQYDSNNRPVKDKAGKVVTATIHCTEGIDVALGKLAHENAVLRHENQQLRNAKQKNQSVYKNMGEVENER